MVDLGGRTAGGRPADARCEATEAESEVGPALHWQLEQRRLRRRLDGLRRARPRRAGGTKCARCATELQFGTDRPFAIILPGGRTLALHGVIDRVDAGPDRLAVIDYKTRPGTDPARPTRSSAGTCASSCPSTPSLRATCSSGRTSRWWPSTGTSRTPTTERKRLPIDVDPRTLARLAEVVAAIVDGIVAGLVVRTRTSRTRGGDARCARTATLDGADTATLWGQWQHKRRDPALTGTGAWSTTWRTTKTEPATPESTTSEPGPERPERRTQRVNGPSGRAEIDERASERIAEAESGDRRASGASEWPTVQRGDRRCRAGRRGRASRIARDLGTTLFVSGRGSGKTTELVRRWSARWARHGHRVDRGHHLHREGGRRAAPARPAGPAEGAAGTADNGDDLVQQRCRAAVDDLDQAALCTLHAFAQRILTATRSRPGCRRRCGARRDRLRARLRPALPGLLRRAPGARPSWRAPSCWRWSWASRMAQLRTVAEQLDDNWDRVRRPDGPRPEPPALDLRPS